MAWWIWSSWIEKKGESPLALYAFAAKTTAPVSEPETSRVDLPSGAKLIKTEIRLDDEQGDIWFKSLNTDSIDEIRVGQILPDAPPVMTIDVREVLVDVFGHSPVRALHYVGPISVDELVNQVPDTVDAISFLRKELGLDFRKEFAGHLGGFDLFEIPYPFDGPAFFESCSVRKREKNILRLTRKALGHELMVAVRMDSLGEVVYQRLIKWPCYDHEVDIDLAATVDSFNVEVYTASSGELVYREDCTFVMEVQLNSEMSERTLLHRDALERRAQSIGARDRSIAKQTTSHTSTVMRVGANAVRTQVRQVQRALQEITDASADKWFSRGIGGELDVIAHIDKLLSEAGVQRAILIDPFFGEDALCRFLLRVRSTSLHLSVIASWGNTDPDTAHPLPKSSDSNVVRLAKVFQAIAPSIACNIQFQNIVAGGGAQAFHDRYLAIYSTDGGCRIWSLSNSINAMAMNWPFCMCELSGLARWEAQRYVEGLEVGNETVSSKELTVTYRWPQQVTTPNRR